MRKVLLLIVTALVTILGFMPTQTVASHNTGGDIFYLYTGVPNTYLLRYRFYRDQAGINAPLQITLCYSSASAGQNGTAILLPVAGTGQLIPPSPCVPAGSGYLIEEWVYEGTVVVPVAAFDWLYSFSECCRNGAVCNINQGSAYVYAQMDNLNWPTNSSPDFASIPVTEFCVNNPFYWNQGAFDIDGDSLVYSIISAQDNNGACPPAPFPCTYIAPATPTDPLPTLSGFNMDPNTGIIYFTPTVQCTYVIAILCEEFDPATGVKKGELNRDMQININANCNIIPPAFDSTFQANGISIVVDGSQNIACDDSIFYLAFNPPIQCGSIVPSDIRFTDPNGVPNPVFSAVPHPNCVNGLTDSVKVTLLYPIQIGTSYVFTKIGFDGNTFLSECGSAMDEFDSIAITLVDSSIYLFNANDTVGCSFSNIILNTNQSVDCYTITGTGSEFTLVDANGVNIPITSIACAGHYSNTININVNPPAGIVGPLYLITQTGTDGNTFTNACGTAMTAGDTIATIVILTHIPVNIGPDQTVCSSSPSPILNAGTFSPSAVYSWTGPNGFTASTQGVTANQSGTYIVTVTDGALCQGGDTVNIVIVNAPVVNLGIDANLCTGDPFPFFDAGNPGASYQWYFNGVIMVGDTFQLLFPLNPGQYVVAVDLGGNCLGYDTVNITVNPNLVINLGNDQTICSNDPIPVLDAGIPGATYVWSGPGVTAGDTLQTLTITQGGTYSVLVTSPTGCSGTDSYTLTIIQAPSVTLVSDSVYCSGDPIDILDAGNPGATYQWSLNGVPIPAATNQTYTPTQSGLYSVSVNNGGLCNATGSINIFIDQTLAVTATGLDYCQGAATPLTATTSNTGITYQWNYNGGTITGATNSTYTPGLGTGSYSVTITTVGGCSFTSTALTINEIEIPTPSLNNVNACAGDPIQTLNANYNNASFGTTYNWNSGAGSNQTFTPTLVNGANNISVTVTNTSGGVSCPVTVSMVYTVTPTPVVSPMQPVSKCSNPNSITTLDAGNTANATYQWFLNGTAIANATNQTYDVGSDASASGTYTVEVTNGGCKGTGGTTVTINANPQPAIKDDKDQTVEVFFCPTPPFPILLSGVTTATTWAWTLNGTTTGTNSSSITVQTAGTYQVTVTDANGCSGTDDIKVSEEVCEIIIPNVFTPNGDGSNQYFEIINLLDFKTRKLTIYNRWGKEIYSNDTYDNKWTGDDASAGTYYYVLEYANETTSKTVNGIINIIK